MPVRKIKGHFYALNVRDISLNVDDICMCK